MMTVIINNSTTHVVVTPITTDSIPINNIILYKMSNVYHLTPWHECMHAHKIITVQELGFLFRISSNDKIWGGGGGEGKHYK